MSADRADPPVTPERQGTPGQVLAAQREAMGWTVEQVADQLKLAVRQVVALEAGDYAALPSPAVTRGFVRAYAKIMRLDPAPLVAQIDLGAPGPNESSGALRRDRPASFSEVRFPTNGSRKSLPLGLIASAVIAVIAIGAAGWKFGILPGLNHPAPAAVAAAPGTAVLAPAVPAATAELQSNNVPLISVPPLSTPGVATPGVATPGVATPGVATPGVGTPSGVAPATVSPAAPAAEPAAPAPGGNALVVSVREDSWVEVRKASGGKPLMARLVKAGKTETFDVSEPVTLVVGKPAGVTATLRGAAVELPLTPGKTFARVALK